MLTPQEIQDQKFEKAVFGGYDMSMVDDFFDAVYNDYSSLYKENAVLKSKMKVLVDKIEEYRSVDDAMRKALFSAQSMANDLIANAKKQSDEMTASAKAEAESRIVSYRKEAEAEQMRLDEARGETERFIDKVIAEYENAVSRLTALKDAQKLGADAKARADQDFEIKLPPEIASAGEPAANENAVEAVSAGDGEDTIEMRPQSFADVFFGDAGAASHADVNAAQQTADEEDGLLLRSSKHSKFDNLRFGSVWSSEDDK